MKALGKKPLAEIFLLGLGLGAAAPAAWAQRPCLPFEGIHPPADSPYVTCTVTMEFVQPLDLDGDGVADFTRERYRSVHRFERPQSETKSYYLHHQDDVVEAYYPAGHVELYWLSWWERDDWGQRAEARLPAGWELRPEPTVGKYWDFPVLRAEGLGVIFRDLEMAPCPLYPYPFDYWCRLQKYARYLWRTPESDCPPGNCGPWWTPPPLEQQTQYFGFRLRRADGWHLGWLQLRCLWVKGDPNPDPVELVAWAVHPEPDAPIVVGKPARPTLQCERGADGGLVVKWSAVWTNAVLERTASLDAPAWVAVSGVQPQGVRLTASEAQGFFRLRVP